MSLLLLLFSILSIQSIRGDKITPNGSEILPQFFLINDASELIARLHQTITEVNNRIDNQRKENTAIDEEIDKLDSSFSVLIKAEVDIIESIKKHERILTKTNLTTVKNAIEALNDERGKFEIECEECANQQERFGSANQEGQLKFELPRMALDKPNLRESLQFNSILNDAKNWIAKHESNGKSTVPKERLQYWAGKLKRFGEFCVKDEELRQEILHLQDRVDLTEHDLWKNRADRVLINLQMESGRMARYSSIIAKHAVECDIKRDQDLLIHLQEMLVDLYKL